MEPDLQKRLIASIFTCPNGVIRMTDGIPGLVETSTNLSIVKTNTKKSISVVCFEVRLIRPRKIFRRL